ncbi:MAG: hypothetical protein ABSE70_09115 [Candidatus Limnocylindrales bacterium]
MPRDAGPARHERPAIDEAALAAARDAEKLLEGAHERGADRWAAFLAEIPDRLRDAAVADLRAVALRARSAYGPKDSIREVLPVELTEPLLADLDRLLRALAKDALSG